MSWIARKGHLRAFVTHRLHVMRLGATMPLGVILLSMSLMLVSGCATQPLANKHVESLTASDEATKIVRFASYIRDLPKAERRKLVRQCEQRLAAEGEPGDAAVHLALLLASPSGDTPIDLDRARKLLEDYLTDVTFTSDEMLDFARYQLVLLDERQRWIKAARRERRARVKLERKLEALKEIERRMTDQSNNDKVPIR